MDLRGILKNTISASIFNKRCDFYFINKLETNNKTQDPRNAIKTRQPCSHGHMILYSLFTS